MSLDRTAHEIVRVSLASYETPEAATAHILPVISDLLGIRLALVGVRDGDLYVVRGAEDRLGTGIGPGKTLPFEKTFCAVVIDGRRTLVIPNASKDPAWMDHPGFRENGIASYIGAPIVLADGTVYGALCGSDLEPRDLGEEDAEVLAVFAKRIAHEVDRKRLAEAERTRMAQLAAFFEEAPDLYVTLDASGAIRDLNRRVEDYGHRRDRALGRGAFDFVHPADREAAKQAFEQALAHKEVRGLKVRLIAADDKEVPSEVNARLVRWPQDEPRVLCVIRDLTVIQRAEKAIEESDAWFEILFDRSKDMAILAMPDGTIVRANEATCQTTGYRLEELAGRPVTIWHPDEEARRLAIENFRKVVVGETVFVENRWLTKGGESLEVEITAHVVRRRGQDLVLGLARDVTERRRLARVLTDLNRDLEKRVVERTLELERARRTLFQSEKMAAIGQLAAGVAHEIRNPLTAINNVLYAIGREMDDHPDLAEGIGIASQEMARIQTIIQNLLEFSRRGQFEMEAVAVNHTIDLALRLVERDLAMSGIEVVKRLTDCPPWQTNPDLLKQVLLNLIVNANQAMGHGGRLTVETTVRDDCLDIRVSDTGQGIPPDDLERIFEPFYTTKPPGEGTGLGLSIVHGAVTEMGGKIAVESKVGVGTLFTISLPGR